MAEPIAAPVPDLPLNELGAVQASALIRQGLIKSSELVSACLRQIDRWDPSICAWAHLDPVGVSAAAAGMDSEIAKGRETGPLSGVPLGIKDIFNTHSMPCQMGSPIWENFTPGNDARVVHYLRLAGALFPGKTVTAEFAVHAPGPTENPHRPGHIPGTSSSGSAAAVAAYMVPAAIGTQTAGSIIRPASYCGIYGFKPSFGLVPRTGMLKTTDTLDTVGWFARRVADLELLFDIVRVKGEDHPFADKILNDPQRQSRNGDRPWRIAFVRGPMWSGAEPYTRDSVEAFARRLDAAPQVEVTEVEAPPELGEAHRLHATIYDKALAYYFKEEFQQHTLVSKQIYEIIERGNQVTLADYRSALRGQRQVSEAVDRLIDDGYDAVIDMATASEALKGLDQVDYPDHSLIWTLAGVPAVSLPVSTGRCGLPLGVQLVARRYNDRLLFELLHWLEACALLPSRTTPEPPMASNAGGDHEQPAKITQAE